jgi:hypothetical protein
MMAGFKCSVAFRSGIVTIALLLSLSFQAKAVVLTPGSAVLTPGTTALPGGTVLTNETEAFTGANFSGTIQLEVVKETGGTLDFYFQLSNSASSINAIEHLTTTNYAGFATDVDWTTNAAPGITSSVGVLSTDATRLSSADTVGFDFVSTPLGSGVLQPGQNSALLFIKTDATQYSAGGIALIDGSTSMVSAFAPVAVPEPGTWVLVGVGVGLCVFLRGRRQAHS